MKRGFSLCENCVVVSHELQSVLASKCRLIFEQTIKFTSFATFQTTSSFLGHFKGSLLSHILHTRPLGTRHRYNQTWFWTSKIQCKSYIFISSIKLGQWLAKSIISHGSKFHLNRNNAILLRRFEFLGRYSPIFEKSAGEENLYNYCSASFWWKGCLLQPIKSFDGSSFSVSGFQTVLNFFPGTMA